MSEKVNTLKFVLEDTEYEFTEDEMKQVHKDYSQQAKEGDRKAAALLYVLNTAIDKGNQLDLLLSKVLHAHAETKKDSERVIKSIVESLSNTDLEHKNVIEVTKAVISTLDFEEPDKVEQVLFDELIEGLF